MVPWALRLSAGLGVTDAIESNDMNPYMLMSGCAIVGWLLVEVFAVFGKAKIPAGMNILGAAAGALISGAFVL